VSLHARYFHGHKISDTKASKSEGTVQKQSGMFVPLAEKITGRAETDTHRHIISLFFLLQ